MKFPMIERRSTRVLTVPGLSGGINLRDAAARVGDNQLTDGKNVWFQGGMLTTRPAVKVREDCVKEFPFMPVLAEQPSIKARSEEATFLKDSQTYQLFSYKLSYVYATGWEFKPQTRIYFRFTGRAGNIDLPCIASDCENVNYFTVQHKNKLYCFVSEEELMHTIYVLNAEQFGDPNVRSWRELSSEEIYTPTVAIHCLSDMNGGVEAVGAEGMNLLTNRYKMVYSTVNRSLLSSDKPTHEMKYYLIKSHAQRDETTYGIISATIMYKNGKTVTHTADKSAAGMAYVERDSNGNTLYGEDGLTLWSDGYQVCFYRSGSQNTLGTVRAEDYVEDNMTLTVDIVNTLDLGKLARERERIFSAKHTAWFGGTSLGMNGGSWLFLGGLSGDDQNKIFYSAAGNPLYFSENSYIGVGKSSQAVTGFGKQDDSLIVFKERELFRLLYGGVNDISKEDLIDQTLVDLAANELRLGLQQIHGYIGCDCPRSIQLCRNRLVWLCGNTVYTLISQSPYSERTVFALSSMVQNRLKAENVSDLHRAFAADWQGHYLLFVGTKIYVMDYESPGFIQVSSYAKEENGRRQIPWFYWELSDPHNGLAGLFLTDFSGWPLAAHVDGERLNLFYIEHGHIGGFDFADYFFVNVRYMDGSLGDDEGVGIEATSPQSAEITSKAYFPIKTVFTTKLFDFNLPQYRKKVPLVNISLAFLRERPIYVTFLGNSLHIEDSVLLHSDRNETENNWVFQNYKLRPPFLAVDRLGLRIESESPVAVDAVSLHFKLLGGAGRWQ